jgi:YD repeat-containing protein
LRRRKFRTSPIKSPGGIVTSYQYERRGYVEKAIGPAERTFRWKCDGSGFVTATIDPDCTTVYERDGAGRVTQVTEIAGSTIVGPRT